MKLYGMYAVMNEGSMSIGIAFSNDLGKLYEICVHSGNSMSVPNDPNRKSLKRHTEEGVYPYYEFLELPYVV